MLTQIFLQVRNKILSWEYSELLDHIVYYTCINFCNTILDQSSQISVSMDQEGNEAIITIY